MAPQQENQEAKRQIEQVSESMNNNFHNGVWMLTD